MGSSRQTSPTVSMWSSPVCATSTTSASGAPSSAAMTPPGAGRQHVGHLLRPLRHLLQAQLAQPLDPALAALGREVAALGEDHERVVLVQAGGQGGDLALQVLAGGRVGRDEARGDPAQDHPDGGVPGQRVLEHHARLARVVVHQGVHQDERVARAGVPAAHQDRPARVRVRGRARDLDREVEHPPGLAEEHPQRALHEVVVDALPVRRADPPAEPGRQPVAEQHDEQHRLDGEVGDHQPQQPQRPPAAGQPGRDGRGGDQPQRRGHPEQQPSARWSPARRRAGGTAGFSRADPVEVGQRGVVRRLDLGLHPGEVAVGEDRVVARRRAAAGSTCTSTSGCGRPPRARGGTGAAGRSRRRPGRPATASWARSAVGRCARPAARRPWSRRGARPGPGGSS